MSRFRLYDLNPEQQSAATHENGPLLILAGAGTGKTRTIVARITWLVSTGTPASKILAVTFTNKAAREMKERIRGMLSEEQADEITASTFHALCNSQRKRPCAQRGDGACHATGHRTALIRHFIVISTNPRHTVEQ